MTTETPKIIDALAYIDTLIDDDEEQKELAISEVHEEMLSFPPEKDYLCHMLDPEDRPFCTDLIRKGHESLEISEQSDKSPNDLAKLQADPPPPASSIASEEVLAKWTKSVNQLKIKLEYRVRQLVNLDLLKTYGSPAWEQYLAGAEEIYLQLNNELADLNKKTQEVNWTRNKDQEKTKRTLDILQGELNKLVHQNFLLSKEIQKLQSHDALKT